MPWHGKKQSQLGLQVKFTFHYFQKLRKYFYLGLTDWCQASPDVENPEECLSAIEWGVPLVFKSLVEADRGWVDGFCMVWGACA